MLICLICPIPLPQPHSNIFTRAKIVILLTNLSPLIEISIGVRIIVQGLNLERVWPCGFSRQTRLLKQNCKAPHLRFAFKNMKIFLFSRNKQGCVILKGNNFKSDVAKRWVFLPTTHMLPPHIKRKRCKKKFYFLPHMTQERK
jgi:hypothetical protein